MEPHKAKAKLPEVTVTKLIYKGIQGVLHQKEVAESVIDAQIVRLVKKFECESPEQLVQRVEGYETLEEMKAELRAAKAAQYATLELTALEERLLTAAAQQMELELPTGYLTEKMLEEVQAQEKACTLQRITLDTFLKTLHKTREQYERELFAKEELSFRKEVCLAGIAKEENIQITAEEIAAEYQSIAAVRGTSLEEAKRGLTEKTVAHALTVRKARALLVQYAEVSGVQTLS